MSSGSLLSIGQHAVQAGMERTRVAGARIASSGVEDVNLANNLVALRQGELEVKAAAQVVKTGDELLGTIIDLKA